MSGPSTHPTVALPEARSVLVLAVEEDLHHVDICFTPFLRRLAATAGWQWRVADYRRAEFEALAAVDLVVFCRPRFVECRAWLRECQSRELATVVMIDDNWLAAGREYPRYRHLFTPGQEPLEIFLAALRATDATLVYSPILAAEVAAYAPRVLTLPPSVPWELFLDASPRPRSRLLVGYAGSPRFDESGFAGLLEFARGHEEVEVLYMGHELPPVFAALDPGRAHFVAFLRPYAAYARALAAWRPDILLAPLDDTRFSASKCPNKYLDIGAVGAAGIYSRVEPYLSYVRHEVTGLLVANEAAAWRHALERLFDDPSLRTRLGAAAHEEIRRCFATDAVLPAFRQTLEGLMER